MSDIVGAPQQSLDLSAQAKFLDGEDGLKHLRDEFMIPTKGDIERSTLAKDGTFLIYHDTIRMHQQSPSQHALHE